MNRILDITLKDLTELTRNRMTFLFLLLMPVIFTLLFGYAFSSSGKAGADPRLPVACLDQDRSVISQQLAGLLDRSTVLRLITDQPAAPAELEQQVAAGDLAAAVIIPAGYGAAAQEGTPIRLTILVDPSSPAGMTIQGDVLAAVSRLLSAIHTAQIVVTVSGNLADFEPATAEALLAWQDPPVRLDESRSSPAGQAPSQPVNSYTHSAPGMMLQFAIAGLLTAAQVLVGERKSRCLQRLLTTDTSRFQILLGHYLAIVLLLLGQFLLLISFGQLVLGLDYFSHPGATLLVAGTSALCIGGLGLLIGVLARTEEQAIMFSLLPMFVLSALGGAWVPLELTGPTFSAVGHLSPIAWALDGFENILVRDLGLGAAWLPGLVLVGFAVSFFLLAMWRFRRVSAA